MHENGNIRRKIALMNARQVIKQFSHLELIKFEDHDSLWIDMFEIVLKQFRRIDSTPSYQKPVGEIKSNYISWIESSISFLNNNKELLLLVPNCLEPIWANVKILDFSKVIEELWDISNTNEFIIADKNTTQIAQVYSEEECFEIHVASCSTSLIEHLDKDIK